MASSLSEVPAHRACAACRSQKVRCIIDDSNSEVCQRCARSGRPCVFTPLQKRKQRKRTDTRVAELEREMRAMRAALQEKAAGNDRSGSPNNKQEESRSKPLGLWYKDTSQDAPRLNQAASWDQLPEEDTSLHSVQRTGPSLWPSKFANKPLDTENDVIDRGMLSMATARHLFDTYRKDLFHHYPMVAIPASMTAEEMRQQKPALFLAVIAAAAGKENSELSAALDKEVLQAYATRSLVQSEKSLELVQALLISAVWYHPPSKFGQLKYYEYIHMATTMAMDIGIGSRPTMHRKRFKQQTMRDSIPAIHHAEDVRNPDLSMSSRSRNSNPDTSDIESRRTFLACYFICAGVSLSLRRPNLLRVSSYIRESVEYLETSPDALPTDPMLVAWVRLIMIAEEISISFCYDDPGGIATLDELRVQLMLKDFEKRLSNWYSNIPEEVGTGSLMIMYYTIRLYLFEIALHVDHSPEDFRAPYQMGGLQPLPTAGEIPTQVLAEAVAESIASAHSLMNTFFAMDPESLRSLPVFSYVRVSFAAFVLAKLCLSAAHPRSRIGRVLDRSSIKAESYLDRAILHVRSIVGPSRSRVPSIFLALLFKLRQWCLNPEIIDQSEQEEQAKIGFERKIPGTDANGGLIELDCAKVMEQASSAETSPQTVGGDSTASPGDTSAKPTVRFAEAPEDTKLKFSNMAPENSFQYSGPATATTNDMNPVLTSGLPSMPMTTMPSSVDANTQGANMWSIDQMNVDTNLLQMLGDINAYSEGGLTGLEDWANMPGDFMMSYDMNWTMTAANAGQNSNPRAGG